jgi:hypothetical protein
MDKEMLRSDNVRVKFNQEIMMAGMALAHSEV